MGTKEEPNTVKSRGNSPRKYWAFLLSSIISITLIIVVSVPIVQDARAYLASPRFGAPTRLDPYLSAEENIEEDNTLQIIVGIDPTERSIPQEWISKENWDIGLSTSYLENATIQSRNIREIKKISNPFTAEGMQDSSSLAKNAVEITIETGEDISPGLYNLHVAYNSPLANHAGIIEAGEYLGGAGSGTGSASFTLSEVNCVYISSEIDTFATEAQEPGKIPFSLIHISDIHVMLDGNSDIPLNKYRLESLMQAISIWAPDILVASGDLTNSPHEYPEEYTIIYELLKDLGVPLFSGNGNHDHKNLGLYPYYFGPIQQANQWGGTRLININSVLPPDGKSLEWAISNIKEGGEQGEATFFVAHYPIMDILDREMQTSVGSILDAMVKYDAAGVLNGHNHYNLVFDMKEALGTYYTSTSMLDACHIPQIVGNSAPEIEDPKIFLVSSAAKDARTGLIESGVWEDYTPFLGYRRITINEGEVQDYTYDYDDDGNRDPSYCHPTQFSKFGGVNWTLNYDPSDLMAGAQFAIINNLTESIPFARADPVLPLIDGYTWEPTNSEAIVRTSFRNATHQFLDIRINAPERVGNTPTTTNIHLDLVEIGGDS